MPRADGMTWAAKASLISTMSTSSMVISARLSACLEASIGPRPMNSGSSAETPVETIRASGVMPSSLALRSDMTTTAAAPSLSGQALPAVTVPSSRKAGFSVASTSRVVPGRGPSSFVNSLAVGQRHRDDLAVEEAVVARLDGRVLALDGVAVHLLAGDLLAPGDVLGRLAHRDVDVGVLLGVAGHQPRVVRVGRVGVAAAVARDAFDPDREEDVALAGLDGVGGHPGGHQR